MCLKKYITVVQEKLLIGQRTFLNNYTLIVTKQLRFGNNI